jgi:hypothetical protein
MAVLAVAALADAFGTLQRGEAIEVKGNGMSESDEARTEGEDEALQRSLTASAMQMLATTVELTTPVVVGAYVKHKLDNRKPKEPAKEVWVPPSAEKD